MLLPCRGAGGVAIGLGPETGGAAWAAGGLLTKAGGSPARAAPPFPLPFAGTLPLDPEPRFARSARRLGRLCGGHAWPAGPRLPRDALPAGTSRTRVPLFRVQRHQNVHRTFRWRLTLPASADGRLSGGAPRRTLAAVSRRSSRRLPTGGGGSVRTTRPGPLRSRREAPAPATPSGRGVSAAERPT